MRESFGAVALIRREPQGQTLWLARWNSHWECYHFVAGHKRKDESFRECMVREVAEELELREGRQYAVAEEPAARLEYVAWSESAQADTAYTMELFDVRLVGDAAREKVGADRRLRWLTEAEIRAAECEDGRPVSKTMSLLLAKAGLWSENPEGGTMRPKVNMMRKVLLKVRADLTQQLSEELARLFPDAEAITVSDCFQGYTNDQEKKVVLGVEVCTPNTYNTHVVKLGLREVVADDYRGWEKCVLGRPFSSRIFVHVSMRDLGNDRAAIIYEDAYQLYGEDTDAHSPQPLETVVLWAIHDDKPDPRSVERVIRQVYADLYRWFYRSPRADAELAARFYRRRLGRALEPWRDDPTRVEVRRDLVWLICGQDAPDAAECPRYIDPYDYVRWVLDQNQMPQTLVGMSHGDVHGRNILVGVQRGEAEYPSVFDYSEMGDSNVLVWDFVKLETELKVRLLMPLFEDQDARQKLLAPRGRAKRCKNLARRSQPSVHADPRSLRAEQLAFAFELESHLAALTNRIFETAEPDSPDPPGGPEITGDQKLDRAMRILLRIRQEAAYWLGARQRQRGRRSLWRDEYYFALAVYGLSTAKWDYTGFETGFALVSAGVAAAQVTSTHEKVRRMLEADEAPPAPYPCYRVPLRHAHRLWRAGKNDQALALLTGAIEQFRYAVPLLQEYAWMLAAGGQYDRALELLKPLSDLCRVFGDYETLSRFGRIFTDLGDRALKRSPVSFDQLSGNHPASQWYRSAYEQYKEASDVADPNEKYYPEINAATMALLRKTAPEMKHSAQKVLDLCAEQDLGDLSPDDRFWVLVTEGEATLLTKETEAAVSFYSQALSNLGPDQAGMAQTAYNQLCRLHWAFGEAVVGPVVEVFKGSPIWSHLEAGPLGNCGQRAEL